MASRRRFTEEFKLAAIADFTQVWTTDGGLYAAVVIDLFARRVVGWSMQSTMTT